MGSCTPPKRNPVSKYHIHSSTILRFATFPVQANDKLSETKTGSKSGSPLADCEKRTPNATNSG